MAPNDGDGYFTCSAGHDHWGHYGAAGALLRHVDPRGQDRYLLGLRSPEVHGGGVWGVPGGAMDSHENPQQTAMRETMEEFGSLPQIHNIRHIHSNECGGGWAYHTVMGDVKEPWEPELPADNWETDDVRWFTPQEVEELPLHSGFRQTWNQLQRPPQRTASTDISSKEFTPRSTRQDSPLFDGGTILAALPEGVKLQEPAAEPEAHMLDSLSLSSVGHNLHYRFKQGGLDPAGAVSYAKRLLQLLGYPTDEITVQAALEAWQQLYPQDQVSPEAINPGKVGKTAAPEALFHPGDVELERLLDHQDANLPATQPPATPDIHNPSTAIAQAHTGQIPGDEHLMGDVTVDRRNPNSGVNTSYIGQTGGREVYIKPEGKFHSNDLAAERASFMIAHHLGTPMPHTVVRHVGIPDTEYDETTGRDIDVTVPKIAQVQHSVGGRNLMSSMRAHELVEQHPDAARQIALLDNVIGNSDRHMGNVVKGNDGNIYPIDHGGAFQKFFFPSGPAEELAREPLTPEESDSLRSLRDGAVDPRHAGIDESQHQAMLDRVNQMLESGRLL